MPNTKIFFVHTHKLPNGINIKNLLGAVFVVELNPTNIIDYYDSKSSNISYDDFFKKWPSYFNKLNLSPNFKWMLSIEGLPTSSGLENKLSLYKKYGLRIIQPFHWAETPYIQRTKLTDLGKKLLHHMQDLDLILDVSHMSGALLSDVIEKYSGRIMASHVVLRDIFKSDCQRSNSLSKEELVALVKRSALIGIPFINDLLDPYGAQPDGSYRASLNNLVEQICSISNIVGAENISIGPDYFNFSYYSKKLNLQLQVVEDLDTSQGIQRLKQELLNNGLKKINVDNFMYKNAERFFRNDVRCGDMLNPVDWSL